MNDAPIAYSWRGEPIYDIEAWVRARGEQFVRYKATRKVAVIGSDGAQLIDEIEEGEMPAAFYDSLLWRDGWKYQELSRRDAT